MYFLVVWLGDTQTTANFGLLELVAVWLGNSILKISKGESPCIFAQEYCTVTTYYTVILILYCIVLVLDVNKI